MIKDKLFRNKSPKREPQRPTKLIEELERHFKGDKSNDPPKGLGGKSGCKKPDVSETKKSAKGSVNPFKKGGKGPIPL